MPFGGRSAAQDRVKMSLSFGLPLQTRKEEARRSGPSGNVRPYGDFSSSLEDERVIAVEAVVTPAAAGGKSLRGRRKRNKPTLPTGKDPVATFSKGHDNRGLSRAALRTVVGKLLSIPISLPLSFSHSRSAVEGGKKSLKIFQNDTARKRNQFSRARTIKSPEAKTGQSRKSRGNLRESMKSEKTRAKSPCGRGRKYASLQVC